MATKEAALTVAAVDDEIDAVSEFLDEPVEHFMTKNPETITKDKLAASALSIMEKHQPRPITVLPVVDGERTLYGIVHLTDLLRQGVV